MRRKEVTTKVDTPTFGGFTKGSYAENGWIVDKIKSVSVDGYEITIICECVHEEDYEV